jgi:hypothetical protein
MWAAGAHLESPDVDRLPGIRDAVIERAKQTMGIATEAAVVGMESEWLGHAAEVLETAAEAYHEYWTGHALELARRGDELDRQAGA